MPINLPNFLAPPFWAADGLETVAGHYVPGSGVGGGLFRLENGGSFTIHNDSIEFICDIGRVMVMYFEVENDVLSLRGPDRQGN